VEFKGFVLVAGKLESFFCFFCSRGEISWQGLVVGVCSTATGILAMLSGTGVSHAMGSAEDGERRCLGGKLILLGL
jgi:hypothetical protein